jgi:hypothetical protein
MSLASRLQNHPARSVEVRDEVYVAAAGGHHERSGKMASQRSRRHAIWIKIVCIDGVEREALLD